tara:strand:+ start:30449 stop:31387 length:939 start_codon:yes stop_codon:yes gene_type:complete
MYTKLTPGEIKKRPYRAEVLLSKLDKKNDDFYLVSGKTIKINKANNLELVMALSEFIKTGSTSRLEKLKIKPVSGSLIKLSDLGKTGEFGGGGKGSGVAAETRALNDIRSKLMAILEKERVPFIMVSVGGKVVKAADFVSTPGTPKSDFHITDPQGKEVAWISHKDGVTAKAYQQYGGLTEIDKLFPGHPEVRAFINDVKAVSGGTFKPSESYIRPLIDNEIAKASVYGIDYRKATGRQHVNMLCQGTMNLKKTGANYKLTSVHDMNSGELPTGDYRCMLFVRKGDRSNFGIGNARFMIAPFALRRGTTKDI